MKAAATTRLPDVGDVLLERYRIEQVIARGGMGVVCRARQLSMDRDVAVKMVLPHSEPDTHLIQRFEREVHLAKQLRHPNVVELYDFGRTEGILYLVMELLDGADLKQVIEESGPMPVGRCGHIALQVLDALRVAHDHGIVHRDLKPSNVFITSMGRHRDFVKLLDFGLSKSLGTDTQTELTQKGQICGTSAYMAPEVFLTGSVDLSVDVYAMGLIVLEMLIGQKVFGGVSTAENMVLHLRAELQVPRELRDTPLGAVLRKSVARRAADRYPNAQEMLREMEAAVDRCDPELRVSEESARDTVASVPNLEGTLDAMLRGAKLGNPPSHTSSIVFVENRTGSSFVVPSLSAELSEPCDDDALAVTTQMAEDSGELETDRLGPQDAGAAFLEEAPPEDMAATVKMSSESDEFDFDADLAPTIQMDKASISERTSPIDRQPIGRTRHHIGPTGLNPLGDRPEPAVEEEPDEPVALAETELPGELQAELESWFTSLTAAQRRKLVVGVVCVVVLLFLLL